MEIPDMDGSDRHFSPIDKFDRKVSPIVIGNFLKFRDTWTVYFFYTQDDPIPALPIIGSYYI